MVDMTRFEAARADFTTAVHAAEVALHGSHDPVIANLIRALSYYSRSMADSVIAVSEQLDDINRNINNVAARLDGKKGPFTLRMR
jgi:hypothetical protein